MNDRRAAGIVARCLLGISVALTALPTRAAVFDEHDTSRLTAVIEEIQSFEDDVRTALHHLPRNDAEQIESYAYVELNLEAAHERLNGLFMLMAVSIFTEAPADEFLILNVMHGQLLTRSKAYMVEKKDAIASMATAHPANDVFVTYRARAQSILGDRAVPLLDELYQRLAELRR